MAKESSSGLGVSQRYGALGNTTEWRYNKTEGSLNELVLDITPDLNNGSVTYTLPKNSVVLAAYFVDRETGNPLTGTGQVSLARTGYAADLITVTGDTSEEGALVNGIGGPNDPSVDDVLTATLTAQDIEGGQATITIRYYNQRNV